MRNQKMTRMHLECCRGMCIAYGQKNCAIKNERLLKVKNTRIHLECLFPHVDLVVEVTLSTPES